MGRLRQTPSMVVAFVALIAGLSGGAYAAVTDSPATLSACVHHRGGGLYRARKCAQHDSRLTWNVAGPRGPAGAQGLPGTQAGQGAQGVAGPPGPSDGYFNEPTDISTPITTTGTDFGAVNVSPGSYLIWATARLISDGTGSNAECFLRNPAGGNGEFENVNLAANPDRKIISAMWAQTVSGPSTFTLRCDISTGATVSVDKVTLAAMKVGTLH